MNDEWFQSGRRLPYFVFFVVLFVHVIPFVHRQASTPDAWKPLYSGRYIAEKGQLPDHREFTFSPVADQYDKHSYTWLGYLTLYGASELHPTGNIYGVQWFRLLIVALTVALLLAMAGWRRHPLILLGIFLWSLGSYLMFQARTQMLAVFFVTALMAIWYRFFRGRDRRWLWLVPVVLMVWSNCHGSFLVGLWISVILGAGYCLDKCLQLTVDLQQVAVLIVILLGASMVVTYLHPTPNYKALESISTVTNLGSGAINLYDNGAGSSAGDQSSLDVDTNVGVYEQVKYRLQNSLFPAEEIRASGLEFPLDNLNHTFVTVSLSLLPIGFMVVLLKPLSGLAVTEGLLMLAVSVLGLSYMRTLAFIPLVVLPILFVRFRPGDFEQALPTRTWLCMVLIGLLSLSTFNIVYHWTTGNVGRLLGGYSYAAGFGSQPTFSDTLAQKLRSRYPDKRFYTDAESGSHLIWIWWPKKKVFMDAMFGAYESSFRDHYWNADIADLLDRRNLRFAVLRLNNPWNFAFFIPNPDWSVIGFDEGKIAYRKVDTPTDVSPTRLMLISNQRLNRLSAGNRGYVIAVSKFINYFQNEKQAMYSMDRPFKGVMVKEGLQQD